MTMKLYDLLTPEEVEKAQDKEIRNSHYTDLTVMELINLALVFDFTVRSAQEPYTSTDSLNEIFKRLENKVG